MKPGAAALLLGLGLAFASPAGHAAEPVGTAERPEPAIPNARLIDNRLLIGGQPEPAALEAARAAGYTLVVNLRTPAEDAGFDEAALVRELGMAYVSLPVGGPAGLGREQAARLDAVLAAHPDERILLHCSSGNRVGALFALRAGLLQGEDTETAVAIGRAHGLTRLEPRVREILENP